MEHIDLGLILAIIGLLCIASSILYYISSDDLALTVAIELATSSPA